MAKIYVLGILLVFLLLLIDVITASNIKWFKVFVEKSLIGDRKNLLESLETVSNTNSLFVVQFLSQFDWPFLGCILSPTQLLLFGGKISPFYKNTTEDTFICYTKLVKDLVYGASIDGTKKFYAGNVNRNEQNLVKGIYLGKTIYCCWYQTNSFPLWILIGFEEPKAFDRVILETLVNDDSMFLPKAGDVWYSNSSTTNGDFSHFKLFSSFPDFTTSGQIVELKRNRKISARYVGIKLNSGYIMYFCSIQIY